MVTIYFLILLIKVVLSFSLPHPRSLQSVVFKLQCAANLPTEPVKMFTGPASTPEILI